MMSRTLGTALLALVIGPMTPGPVAGQEEGRGWIGVKLWCEGKCQREVDGAVVWEFSSPPVVTEVMPGSPADRAGLQAGDTVIAVNGLALASARGARRLGMLMAGAPVEFLVRREGEEQRIRLMPAPYRQVFENPNLVGDLEQWESLRAQLLMLFEEYQQLSHALQRAEQLWQRTRNDEVRQWADSQQQVLGRFRLQIDSMRREMLTSHRRLADTLALRTLYVRPRSDSAWPAPEPGSARTRPSPTPLAIRAYLNAVAGARFQELQSDLGDYFGVEHGLLVLEVANSTPAEAAGLRPGDVILSVGGEPIRSIADLRRALKKGREVQLEIVRKGERQTLAMRSS